MAVFLVVKHTTQFFHWYLLCEQQIVAHLNTSKHLKGKSGSLRLYCGWVSQSATLAKWTFKPSHITSSSSRPERLNDKVNSRVQRPKVELNRKHDWTQCDSAELILSENQKFPVILKAANSPGKLPLTRQTRFSHQKLISPNIDIAIISPNDI